MDAKLFTKMLSDKSVLDLKKLGYKYPQADMGEFVSLLKNGFYHPLPLKDFSGQALVYLNSVAQVHLSAARILLTPQSSTQLYGANAMEEEIISTFTIEQVDFSRDSVRKTLSGFAPADAVLTAPESRSSSPVRILRDETRQSGLRGLYPAGEGAGYAGGITSAAMDGIRVAEAIGEKYMKFQ